MGIYGRNPMGSERGLKSCFTIGLVIILVIICLITLAAWGGTHQPHGLTLALTLRGDKRVPKFIHKQDCGSCRIVPHFRLYPGNVLPRGGVVRDVQCLMPS